MGQAPHVFGAGRVSASANCGVGKLRGCCSRTPSTAASIGITYIEHRGLGVHLDRRMRSRFREYESSSYEQRSKMWHSGPSAVNPRGGAARIGDLLDSPLRMLCVVCLSVL